MNATKNTLVWLAALAALGGMACGEEETATTTESEELEAPEPPPTSRMFAINSSGSKVDFVMEAPLENIHGVAEDSIAGDLFIDLNDITNSRGLVKIDLDQLELFQQKRESEEDEYGEEVKDDTQNAHAKTWFQISEDTPEEVRSANRYIQFNIKSISEASASNILEMEGNERTVTMTVTGDFRLHSRTVEQTAKLEFVFTFDGDEPESVRIRTTEPVAVSLRDHEIRPRSAFDQLAEATLSALGQKVAESAPVTFELTAAAGEAVGAATAMEIETNAAAEEAVMAGVEEGGEDGTEEGGEEGAEEAAE
ncbi:MAG: hypothetical protein AAGF12_33115 [Myxococcota bacterium]